MDPTTKSIFVNFKRADGLFYVLFGDYSEGLDAEHIKWFLWKATGFIPFGIVHMVLFATSFIQLAVSDGGGLYSLYLTTPSDIDQNWGGADTAITATLVSPVIVNSDDDGNLEQINTARVRLKMTSANAPTITVQGISAADSAKVGTTITIPFVGAAGKTQDKWVYLPWVDEQPQVKLTAVSTGFPLISRIAIEGDVYGESDPQ